MQPSESSIYRAVWRWHFYAGLIVLPVALCLAITGALYLYKAEIEGLVYSRWSTVTPSFEPVRLDRLINAVEGQSGAKVVQIARPAEPSASWRVTLAGSDGTRQTAFVDPYRARILYRTSAGGIMQTVRSLHSLSVTGPIGNMIVEIVAGWVVLLVGTGLYLWWPRRGSPVVGLRGSSNARLFWRDLHASVGVMAAPMILFLALTGMPWTEVTGTQLQMWIGSQGFGRPQAPMPNPGGVKGHGHGSAQSLPWSMQQAIRPTGHGAGDIGPDRVAALVADHGLSAPWTMTLPATANEPYLISKTIVRANDARALYVEAATGRLLQDARYASFGAGARIIEWGIATHQGQQYGEANRLVMLAGCLAIITLAMSAPVLWWRRRRGGKLEAPPRAVDAHKVRGIAAIMIVLGLLFPLTGLTVLAALLIDKLVVRKVFRWSRARTMPAS